MHHASERGADVCPITRAELSELARRHPGLVIAGYRGPYQEEVRVLPRRRSARAKHLDPCGTNGNHQPRHYR